MSELRRRAVIAAVANPLRTEVPALLVRCEQCRHCRVTRNGSPQRSGVSSTPSRNTIPSSTRGTTLTAWGTVRTRHGRVWQSWSATARQVTNTQLCLLLCLLWCSPRALTAVCSRLLRHNYTTLSVVSLHCADKAKLITIFSCDYETMFICLSNPDCYYSSYAWLFSE